MTDRNYRKVSPEFWTGETGKTIQKAGPAAIIVAVYCMTCHHSLDTGIFRLPVPYAMEDTGLSREEVEQALTALEEARFLTYDSAGSVVFVHEMGRFQIGEALKPTDKRVKGVLKRLDPYRKSVLYAEFMEKYAERWSLGEFVESKTKDGLEGPSEGLARGLEGPSEGLARGNESGKTKIEAPPKPKERTKQKQEQSAQAQFDSSSHHVSDQHTPQEQEITRRESETSAAAVAAHKAPEAAPGTETPRDTAGAADRLAARAQEQINSRPKPKDGRVVVGGKKSALIFGGDSNAPITPWQMPNDVYDAIHAALFAPIPTYKKPRPPHVIESDKDEEIAAQMLLAYKAAYEKHNKGKTFRGNCGKRSASIALCGRVLREEKISPWHHFDVAFRLYKSPRLFTVASEKAAIRVCEEIKKERLTMGGESQAGETAQALARIRSSIRMSIYAARPGTPDAARNILKKHLDEETIEEIHEMIMIENDKMAELDRKSLTQGKWIWT